MKGTEGTVTTSFIDTPTLQQRAERATTEMLLPPIAAALWQTGYHEGFLDGLAAARAKALCHECGDLWDDHQPIEEVDGGLALALAASGETDSSQIVTCYECRDCYEEPPQHASIGGRRASSHHLKDL